MSRTHEGYFSHRNKLCVCYAKPNLIVRLRQAWCSHQKVIARQPSVATVMAIHDVIDAGGEVSLPMRCVECGKHTLEKVSRFRQGDVKGVSLPI